MDFEFTESQRLVRETARAFAERALRPHAAQFERDERVPSSVLRELADLGLLGVNVDASLGGAEAGVVAYSLALTEVARGCASTAVIMSVSNMVAEIIAQYGNESQREKYVRGLVGGDLVAGSFALSEPGAGSDPGAMLTTAVRDGDRWILRGEKQWITSGDIAGVYVVWARTGGPGTSGISTFLLDRGTPGLKIGRHEDKTGQRASGTVPLSFDDCALPADALLGELHGGFRIAMTALDGGRIGVGSLAVGVGTAALEAAVEYARERKQFGRAIGDFQAIQWMLADSRTELDAARLMVLRAATMKDRGVPFSREAAMAKVFASERANAICDRAVQVHGGYGYVKEFPVERHLRDIRVTRIYEGTSEIQRTVIARSVLR